ncbi:hypothetical protein ACHIPZ_18345 [Antrihabitans sp. NCIMB 15449]|uniref:Uncharacterized protein n=1 Tax=Antrihabitans spumae TaxID=3373370 RepID=A0ABW7JQT2_9NOCA
MEVNKASRQAVAAGDPIAAHYWQVARALYRTLRCDGPAMESLDPGPIVLRRDERVHLHLPTNYARYIAIEDGYPPAWDVQQSVDVLVTTDGLIVTLRDGDILRFDWERVTAFYPEPTRWTVTFQFDGEASPLRLRGYAAPQFCVYATLQLRSIDYFLTSDPLSPLL